MQTKLTLTKEHLRKYGLETCLELQESLDTDICYFQYERGKKPTVVDYDFIPVDMRLRFGTEGVPQYETREYVDRTHVDVYDCPVADLPIDKWQMPEVQIHCMDETARMRAIRLLKRVLKEQQPKTVLWFDNENPFVIDCAKWLIVTGDEKAEDFIKEMIG